MKKNLLAGLLLLWACSVYGQKRIVDPVRSDFSYVAKFDRVEITGKRTVAEVTLRYLPNYWIRYDSLTTYLQDCGSDRRYRLLAAEGFELNKEVYMPESGEMKARFIFDPVDADVRASISSIRAGKNRIIRTEFFWRDRRNLRYCRIGRRETG